MNISIRKSSNFIYGKNKEKTTKGAKQEEMQIAMD